MNKKAQGFTIVELLIVIVVIAILAAISIAAYTNIQQRAKSTAIINAARQSLKMIQAYIAANGDYPAKSRACITIESECQIDASIASKVPLRESFNINMATIGIPPKSVPTEGDHLYGITYGYDAAYIFDTEPRPARLIYYLFGRNQQCGIAGVMRWSATNEYIATPIGYTDGNAGGLNKTLCWISIPGPAHS